MLKRCLLFLFAIPGIYCGTLSAYPKCAPELSLSLKRLYLLPEARKLIQHVESEGIIEIRWAYLNSGSSAVWQGGTREIILNAGIKKSDGQKMCSILFELHNALSNREFCRIDSLARRGLISKNDYIIAIERIEHQNALKTIALIEKGIREKFFPIDARWNILPNFEEHYTVQLRSGHAQAIACIYDYLNPYQYCVDYRHSYASY